MKKVSEYSFSLACTQRAALISVCLLFRANISEVCYLNNLTIDNIDFNKYLQPHMACKNVWEMYKFMQSLAKLQQLRHHGDGSGSVT